MVKYDTIKECLESNDKKVVNKVKKQVEQDIKRTNKSIQVLYNKMLKNGQNDTDLERIKSSIGYLDFLNQWLPSIEDHLFELQNDIKEYDLKDIKKELGL